MKTRARKGPSRRDFLRVSLAGSAGLLAPAIVPRTYLFGAQTPPSRRIAIAQIGCGRMGLEDMRGTMKHDLARIVAVCDVDSKRLEQARAEVQKHYGSLGESRVDVKAYRDYREVLSRPDIDAVIVSTPDHWHALPAVAAALAGKDLYVQKPLTYDIREAITLRRAVRAKHVILQTGSQQRSSKPWDTFRIASEAVRNGRIGKLQLVRIGVGRDKRKGAPPAPQPVPTTFDYDAWLGPAPQQPYMETRVHPQEGYGRPGWMTTEDFGLGMITNWGTHHVDIAHWGMGMELGGPTSVEARATFMTNDVWTVHDAYHIHMAYPNGVTMVLDDSFPNGIRWEGNDGWVFCERGATRVTASDPGAQAPERKPLEASRDEIFTEPLGSGATRWPASDDHYLDWLQAVAQRKDPIGQVEQAARSLEACAIAWIGMKLGRRLLWDAEREAFKDDAEANRLCARPPRGAEYDVAALMRRAGLS